MEPSDERTGSREHPVVAAHARAARWAIPVAVVAVLLCAPWLVSAATDLLAGGAAAARMAEQRALDEAWCARECPDGIIKVDDNCAPSTEPARRWRERLDAHGCTCEVRMISIWSLGVEDE